MARDMDNPDRRGKDMDMSDTRTRWYCEHCDVVRPGNPHKEGCPYHDD